MVNFVVVIDTQYDFMMSDGILYVEGSEDIIVPINKYLAALNPEETAGVLFTFDTHTKEQYEGSPESEMFPIHCELGTKGHNNVINAEIVNSHIPVYVFRKPVFNMWADEASEELIVLYNSFPAIYKIDDFFLNQTLNVAIVDVIGVALNFCVKQAVDGFLERGYTVRLHPALTRGIDTGKPGDLDANVLYADEIAQGKIIISE